jgi:hypothetical protein
MEHIAKRYGATAPAFKHPQRISVTVSWYVLQALQNRADHQGRSLSNLAAYELERALAATATAQR